MTDLNEELKEVAARMSEITAEQRVYLADPAPPGRDIPVMSMTDVRRSMALRDEYEALSKRRQEIENELGS